MNHIFLYGPSGSGKSTVGNALASSLNLSFVDSDQLLEKSAGKTIPQIAADQGLEKMRDLETETLKQIVNDKECVVALGGGALLRDENRKLVEQNGQVILLNVELSTLVARVRNDPNERPLLAGDLEEKLTSYLARRREHYASFPIKVQVDEKNVEQLTHDIEVMIGRYHLSAMGEYDVQVGRITNLPDGNIIVTDKNVARHHLDTIQDAIGRDIPSIIIPAGEEYKNLETVSLLWKSFLQNGLDRKSTVIALGGGVIGDLTGFAASTYMRGINWCGVPTTLLSMVDASIGGKTGFDLLEGKNLIGSFHPPKLVFADPNLLLTLPERELISGMAEVVKHGIISDPELFALFTNGMDWIKDHLEEIVKRAIAVKKKIIEVDPYEKGFRAALNLGHTVGHAVELVSQFELRHGEAIAVGTVVEARYAEQIGIAEKGLADKITETLSALGLPTQIPDEMPRGEIIRAMRVDKKKTAKAVRFALPVKIGKVELVEVSDLENVIASVG